VTARKEVILSAGVFGTPQLLMLSGIGDPTELKSLGIDTRVDLPSVGKNMSDHTFLINAWQINTNETFETYLAPDALPQSIQEWNQTHRGPLSWTVTNQMAWMRLPRNDTIIQTHGDPSPGPTSAHYQLIWANGWIVPGVPKPEGSWMSFGTNLISPTSRKCLFLFTPCLTSHHLFGRIGGTLKLRSLDPFDPPIIDPNYLATEFDIKTIIVALKAAKRFLTAEAWKGFIGVPWADLGSANTDEELVRYVRNHASTYVEIMDHFALGSPDTSGWV